MSVKAHELCRIRDQLLACIGTLESPAFMFGGNADAVKIAIEHLNHAVGEIDAQIASLKND